MPPSDLPAPDLPRDLPIDRALQQATVRWLGVLPFDRALDLNEQAALRVQAGAPGELLAFEPDGPVYTLGLRARTPAGRRDLATTLQICQAQGIPVRQVDRGGLGTLHLPGQLVLFLALPCDRAGLRPLVARLLHAAAHVARRLGVPARVDLCDDVGVWTDAGKLASLGLYESGGVVRHGLSLQVAIDRGPAQGLVLCGRASTRLASLDALLHEVAPNDTGRAPPVPSVEAVARQLCRDLQIREQEPAPSWPPRCT